MLILGISSAAESIEVSLLEDGHVLSEYLSQDDIRSEDIVKHIDLIFSLAKRDLKELGALALTIGPGSYGGLRGALAAAKAFAQTLNIPIMGVPTADAVAENLLNLEGLVMVALHAMKDDFNAAMFGIASGKARRLTGDFLARKDKLALSLSRVIGAMYLADASGEIFQETIKRNPLSRIRPVDQLSAIPRAASVAKRGAMMLSEGETLDPLSSRPHYSHEPNIREFKK